MSTTVSKRQMNMLSTSIRHPRFIPMNVTNKKSFKLLICTVGLCTLSACGWVDSTGAQTLEIVSTEGLRNAQPLTITENTAVTAQLLGEGSNLQNWIWTAENKNEIDRCAGIDGFDTNFAVSSLAEACASQADCSIGISESVSMGNTQFSVTMPTLQAPVAISYDVSTTREDGATVSRQQLLCGVSVNEAPQALDDSYVGRHASVLVVNASDADNLLSNDVDDVDFRNSPLQVITTPVREPLYASQFSLDSNGGFTYEVSQNAPVNSSGITEDSFAYAITDGIHTVSANVIVKIIGTNEAPEQLQQIPDLLFTAADGVSDAHIRQLDLSVNFRDPDGDKLFFQSDDIDSTFGLTLSTQGILVADASILDVNQWRATIQVSDGVENISSSFVVTIRLPDAIKHTGGNAIPTVTDIRNSSFTDTVNYDVSPFFTDIDKDDQLTFTARGLPAGIQIRADGVIEGDVDASNRGRVFVRVTAEDGYGGSVTDGFNLTLN